VATKKSGRNSQQTKNKRGRKTKYREEFCTQAEKLCALGATDRDLADFFHVSESTLNLWKLTHPEFSESLKDGKDQADKRVEQSLYRRALGYSHDAVKILQDKGNPVIVPYVEHHPPDTTACIFWLKNRRPDRWRDLKALEHSGEIVQRHVNELTDDELTAIAAGGSAGAATAASGAAKSQ